MYLIYVEDRFDSSKNAGKLMFSVLSSITEIERKKIRIKRWRGYPKKLRRKIGRLICSLWLYIGKRAAFH